MIPHFFTEEAAMKLSFAVLLAVAGKRRGVRMDVFTTRQVEELRNELCLLFIHPRAPNLISLRSAGTMPA